MNRLRILAPSGDEQPLRWARLPGKAGETARGDEGNLALAEGDDGVDLVLPAERVSLLSVSLSAEQRTRLSDANLPWLVEPGLVQEVERMHLVRGELDKDGFLPVFAVDRSWLEKLLARLAERQIRPDRILAESLLVDWRDNEWSVVLKPQGGFVRTGREGGFLLDSLNGGGVPAMLAMAARSGAPAGGIRVFGTEGGPKPDLLAWSAATGVRCDDAGPWAWTAELPAPVTELARGDFSPPGRGRHLWRRLRIAFGLVAAIVAINLLGLGAKTVMALQEKKRLQAEIEASLLRSFPETSAVLDPVLQMQQGVQRLAQQRGVATAQDFLPLLGGTGPLIDRQLAARVEEMNYLAGRGLDLLWPDQASAEAAAQTLKTAGYRIELEQQAGSTRVRLRVGARS